MSLLKVSYCERVEIVFNPDGTMRGAMAKMLEGITDSGQFVPGAARYVDIELAAEHLDALLPDSAALLAQNARLLQRAEIMTAELQTAGEAIRALAGRVENLRTALGTAVRERDQLAVAAAHMASELTEKPAAT